MHRRTTSKTVLLATLYWLLGSFSDGTAMAQDAGIWPTTGWETSSPEQQGMDSGALADLVRFGASEKMDSLLVTRHGRIVAESYYAPFQAGLKHRINSATKAVVGTLIAVASRMDCSTVWTIAFWSFFQIGRSLISTTESRP